MVTRIKAIKSKESISKNFPSATTKTDKRKQKKATLNPHKF